jgi:hypothetical protein
MFEVNTPDNKQFVIDLCRRRCGCRKWEITRTSCSHAVAIILYDYRDPEDYVDECFTIKVYKKAYAPVIYPMPSEEQWVKISHDKLEPPRGRIAPGRSKRQRIRAPDESRDPQNPNWMRKFGVRMQCGKCHGLGHNKRSCPTTRSEAYNSKKSVSRNVSFSFMSIMFTNEKLTYEKKNVY